MAALPDDPWPAAPAAQAPPARPAHWPALVGYLAVAFALTFPGVLRLGSHTLGTSDALYFVWELWWFHHAAFVLHTDPLVTPLLFHPTPSVPLIWSTPVNLLPGMALVGLLGPVGTYNLLVLTAIVLSGYGAYRLAWHGVRDRRAAFLAGLIFAFAPAHMGQVIVGHLGVLSVQWTPFCALALWRLAEAPSWRRAAVFAVTTALVAGSDLYVAIYFFGALALGFVGFGLWRDRARFLAPAFWGRAGVAGLAGLAAVAPFYLATWRNLQGASTTTVQGATVDRFGQDLLQLLLPAPTHPLFGALSRPFAGAIANQDSWGTLSLTAVALAGLALWKRRAWPVGAWGAFTAVALVGSLGTALMVAGAKLAPMPYAIAAQLPVLKALRVPGRLAEIAALGLGLLAAYGLAWWLPRLGDRAPKVFGALVALVGLESLIAMPFPTSPTAVPAFYRSLAATPGGGALLELPNGDLNYGGPTHRWMYYQTIHQRPLVFGHTHRVPNGVSTYYWNDPVVRAIARMGYNGRPLDLAPSDRRSAAGRLAGDGVSHVIVHRVPGMVGAETFALWQRELTELFGAPVYTDAEMAAFETGMRSARKAASAR